MNNQPKFDEFEQVLNFDGSLITFEFTMMDKGEVVIDSNVGKSPMIFQSGIGEIMQVIEDTLISMPVGEAKRIIVPPEDAYGEVLVEKFKEFPIEMIPKEARKVGRKVMSRKPDGTEEMVDVVSITDNVVTLNFNHTLAGMTLLFDLKVISNDPLN